MGCRRTVKQRRSLERVLCALSTAASAVRTKVSPLPAHHGLTASPLLCTNLTISADQNFISLLEFFSSGDFIYAWFFGEFGGESQRRRICPSTVPGIRTARLLQTRSRNSGTPGTSFPHKGVRSLRHSHTSSICPPSKIMASFSNISSVTGTYPSFSFSS